MIIKPNVKIIKLDAVSSTNSYLKELSKTENLSETVVVWTHNQVAGRGQQGAKWVSEPYKNLTFSVLKQFSGFSSQHHFLLNMLVSLSVFKVLKRWQLPNLALKWPNDILADSKKICGILIENTLVKNEISTSVIGIGLNVNQLHFEGLENKATSLQKITGIHFNLEELLQQILEELLPSFEKISVENSEIIFEAYHSVLFRKDKPSTFETFDNQRFMGFIRGVTQQGELRIELEDNIEKQFQLKEISLLY